MATTENDVIWELYNSKTDEYWSLDRPQFKIFARALELSYLPNMSERSMSVILQAEFDMRPMMTSGFVKTAIEFRSGQRYFL